MPESAVSRPANRLAGETSPYLLQHAHNPVHWYPWGDEALARARAEQRPILLSIGYAACHWCHVMERESFEDEETAAIMNRHFVCVKVDREERPDLDAIYMQAVQAMTGHGGWPMTVFLTPDGEPFWGGTYFPPEDRHGLPSFRRVLLALADAWETRRDEVVRKGGEMAAHLKAGLDLRAGPRQAPEASVLTAAASGLLQHYDARHGGFGDAPKFPQPMAIEVLLRHWHRTGDGQALAAVEHTLRAMAQGGLYDHLGGGFHRYSVDAHWLVPHFEKMLYDNALLARAYLQGYQATGSAYFRQVAEATLDYVLRDMADPQGGFYSTEDADSEGEEGRFYVWTPGEVAAVLGEEDGRLFCAYYGVTAEGNFEDSGASILHVRATPEEVADQAGVTDTRLLAALERGRALLLQARSQRVRPGRDEKVLAAWNGLMLRALAEAAAVLDRADYRQAAERCAAFLLDTLVADDADGLPRVRRTWKPGHEARLNGYLEDYANLADGLVALYEATFDPRWLAAAVRLADAMIARFADETGGGFFDTSADHEALITRPRDLYDNATPSGNAVAADVLLRLALLTANADYQRWARTVVEPLVPVVTRAPLGFGRVLAALDFLLSAPKEVAIIGDSAAADTRTLLAAVHERYLPNRVIAGAAPGSLDEAARLSPLLEQRVLRDGRATAYVCEQYACLAPTTDPDELRRQLWPERLGDAQTAPAAAETWLDV